MTELITSASHSTIIEGILQKNPSLHPAVQDRENVIKRLNLLKPLLYLPVISRLLPSVDSKQVQIAKLLLEQKSAKLYSKWYEISVQLDELTGNNSWKLNPESSDYDYELVFKRLKEMREARLSKDYKLLLYLIRTKWTRNFANMGNLRLYRHSHVGTKRLVEEYIEECRQSLHFLVHDKDVKLDDRYLLGMLIQTRKNIGRTALLLSGGATFGISHIGVLIVLLETGLMPRIVSGSSSGSIIASILCCHTNEEIVELLGGITDRQFSIFGLSTEGVEDGKLKKLLERVSHFIKYGTLFDIEGLQETMYDFLGDLTFREAYNRTGKILNITVSPESMHEQTRLLNYLTAPHCLVWSAVCASCSLPGVFPSSTIYERNPRTYQVHEWNNDESLKYVDGSVDGDLPITRLSEMFNVDHIIAVQVNPHISPVLKVSIGAVGGFMDSELSNVVRSVVNDCYDFVVSELIHYLQVLNEMNVQKNLTSKCISLLTQKYSGDVTILPDLAVTDFLSIFSNPTPEFLFQFILKGARAAWPKITVINNHCGVEFALDREISNLRGRLIASAIDRVPEKAFKDVKNATSMVRDGELSSYLISSPVLNNSNGNTEQLSITNSSSSAHNTPRRHNSATQNDFPQFNNRIKKRNTIAVHKAEDKQEMLKGKSMLSLLSIAHEKALMKAASPADDEDEDEEEDTLPTPTNDSGSDLPTRRIVRKARSSGNFHTDPQTEAHMNPYNFRTSPKFERTIHNGFDYQEFASKFQNNTPRVTPKEKANLPKKSNPNSLRNSYIGLNRLKDQTSHQSSFKMKSNSRDSSFKDLRSLTGEQEQVFRDLHSPDLRRSLSKKKIDGPRKVTIADKPSKGEKNGTRRSSFEASEGDD